MSNNQQPRRLNTGGARGTGSGSGSPARRTVHTSSARTVHTASARSGSQGGSRTVHHAPAHNAPRRIHNHKIHSRTIQNLHHHKARRARPTQPKIRTPRRAHTMHSHPRPSPLASQSSSLALISKRSRPKPPIRRTQHQTTRPQIHSPKI